jgi:transposase-like protein
VAERFGIRPNLLTAWRRRRSCEIAVSKPKKRVRFSAVRIKSVAADGTIEIDPVNRLVRVQGIVDAGMLREILTAIR